MKAVVCGCGAMAKGWLRALAETPALKGAVEIVGLVDVDLSAAEALAKEFFLENAITGRDLNAVLEATRPDLVFDIVVPSARHHVVSTALGFSCHVLSEKPMAASLEEAEDLIALARRAGCIHAIVQNRRFISGVRRMRRVVETGTLGDLTGIHCDFFIGPHFGGFRERMDNVLLLDMAIHTFDAARFVSGKTPLAVYCHESNPPGSWYRHGAAANAIFEFSDNVVFTYRGSWCAEGARTSWESAWRVIGTRGTLLWDGADKLEAHVVSSETGFLREVSEIEVLAPSREADTHGHASVIHGFLNAVRTGVVPETDGNDNVKSLAMVFGAIESARRRERVAITA